MTLCIVMCKMTFMTKADTHVGINAAASDISFVIETAEGLSVC